MKQYICTVCGYIHETEGELPDDFKCPICGAGKDSFVLKEETAKAEEILEKPHTEKELSPMEMSIICSNLARGCEKQYMPEESEKSAPFLQNCEKLFLLSLGQKCKTAFLFPLFNYVRSLLTENQLRKSSPTVAHFAVRCGQKR